MIFTVAREIKRLESILRSYVYAHFGETLNGLTTIRAYKKQKEFIQMNEIKIDIMNRAVFISIINQCWLGIRLDFIGGILTFAVSVLVVVSRSSVSPSIGGLILTYCSQVVTTMGWVVRHFATIESNMNAVERVHHYAAVIKTEAPLDIWDKKPRTSWPENGNLDFNEVVLRYRDGLPAVLKNLNLHIKGGERIGIGKSVDGTVNA